MKSKCEKKEKKKRKEKKKEEIGRMEKVYCLKMF